MTQTNVPKHGTVAEILTRLQDVRRDSTPELSKLVTYLLENPNEIGVSSIRQLAAKADVKPNTLVRLSRAIGMESYEAFREVFRASIRLGRDTRIPTAPAGSRRSPSGVKWAGCSLPRPNPRSTISKASLPRSITRRSIRRLQIVDAHRCYVLGVGVNHGVVQNFAYLAAMAIDGVRALPQSGMLPIDGLRCGPTNATY